MLIKDAAHSIQKAKALKTISVNDHVKTFSAELSFDEPPEPNVEDKGINRPTTFRGLCSRHDNLMFIPIDDHTLDNPTDEQLFFAGRMTGVE
jgi:hypothetical protein